MFVRLAVAVDQGDLALVKSALDGSGALYYVSDEYHATCGGHPDFFPVFVAEEDQEKARTALKEFCLERTLVQS